MSATATFRISIGDAVLEVLFAGRAGAGVDVMLWAKRDGKRCAVDVVFYEASGERPAYDRLSSFGGDLWPSSFPEFFEHVGPHSWITSDSGPQLRRDIAAILRAAFDRLGVAPADGPLAPPPIDARLWVAGRKRLDALEALARDPAAPAEERAEALDQARALFPKLYRVDAEAGR